MSDSPNKTEKVIDIQEGKSNLLEQSFYQEQEPQTHKLGKSFLQKYFGACVKKNYDLNKEEIQVFSRLKKEANISFDQQEEEHLQILTSLWYVLTNENLQQIKNEGWKYYGFQNPNPVSDVRGGGLIAVKLFHQFCVKNREEFKESYCLEENEFLLACTSINITYFLKIFFHLAHFLKFEQDKKDFCDRLALQNFCVILSNQDNIMMMLHDLLLQDIFKDWVKLKKEKPKTNFMDFGPVILSLQQRFKDCMENNQFTTYVELETTFLLKYATDQSI